MRAKLIFCSTMLLFVISIQAQVVAGIGLSNECLGEAKIDDPDIGKFSIVSNKVTAAIPIPIKKNKLFLLNRLSLNNIQIDLHDNEKSDKTGQNYGMMNILMKSAKNNLNYFVGCNTSIVSIPGKEINRDNLKGVGFAGFIKNKDNLKYGVALAYMDNSERTILFPMFIVNWKLKNKTKISGFLPLNLSIMNSHSDQFEYGFETALQFNDILIEQNEREFLVNSIMWKSGPVIKWKISKYVKFSFKGGSMLYNSYNIRDAYSELFSFSTDRSWFVSSQLIFGF